MKKIFTLCCVALMATAAMAETHNGIIAYANGGTTAYLLSETPEVTYQGTNAILTVNGKAVATVKLEGDQTLSIVYGEYDTTGINGINNGTVTRVGKYIQGGQLIIVDKDGNKYNSAGQRIK